MSITDGARAPKQDGEGHVVQIYPRPSQDTAAYCPLQVSPTDTAQTVVHNAVVHLGLDSTRVYSLLEVRGSSTKEMLLEPGDYPLERVLQWPPEAQKWHPQNQGYYFILQQQANDGNDESNREDYDDLCNLETVTEESVLEVLCQRFYRCKIYTYARNILIAINPNKFLPVYYNPKYVKMYENQPLGKLSPHIFGIADVAFRTMLSRKANQCIVISGESGSGKTESSSYLIHCLTALSQKTYSGGLERTILGAGPVLEAFGNAKTAENNNSSRFGKFFQLNYLESGVIRGAVIEKYLLEKCRLVSRDKRDRNYHVFYYLLAGASKDEQEEYHLLKLQDYRYLKQKDLQLDDEDKLGHEYKRLHQAMEMVGFLPSTKKHIFSILSAILLLGNVTYSLSEDSHNLEVGPPEVLLTLSDLLKVKEQHLVNTLTKKRIATAKAMVVSQYTLQKASKMRDSMAKSLYSALFDWIVLHINHAMLNRRDMEESVSCLSIGILDMFGFENLQTNSLEQLCINYANEKLQYYINQNLFELEQEEYVLEGIAWQNIYYSDNSGCIQLIGGKPTGLFDLLDRESNLPQATDETLLNKLKLNHQDNPLFELSPNRRSTFTVRHFAGRVIYDIKDFREKNTEHMRPEVVSLLRSSERAFLHNLVAFNPEALFRWGVLRATIRILTVFKMMGRQRAEAIVAKRSSRKSLKEIRHCSSAVERMLSNTKTLDFSFDNPDENPLDVFEDIFVTYEMRKRTRGSRKKQLIPKNLVDLRSLRHVVGLTAHDQTSKSIFHPHPRTSPLTVSSHCQASLRKLMETIENAEPFFIICMRSNSEKRELQFDKRLVLHQIKYMGILQMVNIQKTGYSTKYTFKEFVEKFRMLLPKGATPSSQHISELFNRMELDKTSYQIGNTKVFLNEKERQLLQDTQNKEVMYRIITLQRWFRDCLIRLHFLQKRDARRIMERNWREYYIYQSRAATVIQTAWRSSQKKAKQLLKEGNDNRTSQTEPGHDSFKKKEFKRQQNVECGANGIQQPDSANGQSAQTVQSKEKQEGRASPSVLKRPLSVPVDSTVGHKDRSSSPSKSSSLQRYKDMVGIKEKAERWKEKYSEGESSPEMHRAGDISEAVPFKAKAFSVDDASHISSLCSDSSPVNEVRVRHHKRKRHLANTRSHLMFNFRESEEDECWSFPLPPISPCVVSTDGSERPAVQALESQVKMPPETDGSRFSLPSCIPVDDVGQHDSGQSPLTTPERVWFLGRFLKKLAPKTNNDFPTDKTVTLPRYNPHPYHMANQNIKSHRNPTIRISRATRAIDWNASLDRVITNPKELRNLDEFLGNQVNELQTRIKKLSPTENIFFEATKEFRETIKGMYSLQKPQIGYKDLMQGYHTTVSTLAGAQREAEIPLVVNLFQSVLDGFIRGELKRMEFEPTKVMNKRKQCKSLDCILEHLFSIYQVNVMQTCDVCGSQIRGMEKAYICSACNLICHKKCLNKVETHCSKRGGKKDGTERGSLHFGVQVCALVSDTSPVPKVVEMLLLHVELNGLYTEGIYRKSGSACRVKELHHILDTNPEAACLDTYQIHTIAGLVKRWLRELPDPLMTFSLYRNFLQAVELPEKAERIRAIYQTIEELPPANYSTLERLIFHLVRVAKEEEHNKMSPGSLAIVFAPCILHSPDSDDPFLCMNDLSKTTMCVEILICEQLRRYTEKMRNINELEYAEALAVNQLKLKRQNTVLDKPLELDIPEQMHTDETEKTLLERIESIKQEKVDLACGLLDLEQEQSDNENLESMSSVSSESLEELLGSVESEGKVFMQLKTQTCDVPSNLEQRSKIVVDVIQPMCFLPSWENLSPPNKPQVTNLTYTGSLDDLDIPYIDEDEDQS
ncbi:unconventional myosin-IXb isoform X2 [Channa argus]|uniref:unconventional myosin-IXb isoform X2 n=1 Tax=Channa argus TaxID=215402 RepID=UPI003521215B